MQEHKHNPIGEWEKCHIYCDEEHNSLKNNDEEKTENDLRRSYVRQTVRLRTQLGHTKCREIRLGIR